MSDITATPSSSQANEGKDMRDLLKRIKKNLKTKNGEVLAIIDEDTMLSLVEELETVQVTKEFLKSTGFGKIMRMIGGKTKYMSTSRKIKQLLKKYKYVVMDSINSKMQEYKEEFQEYHQDQIKTEELMVGEATKSEKNVKGLNNYFTRMKCVEDEIKVREECSLVFLMKVEERGIDLGRLQESNEKLVLKRVESLDSGKPIQPYTQ